MSYVQRAYRLVLKQPILFAVPVALGFVARLVPVSTFSAVYAILSGRVTAALLWGIASFVVSAATISGYNAMVAGVVRGETAGLDKLAGNLSRFWGQALTGLVVAALAYGLMGVLLPISMWFLFTPLFLVAGALTHVWLAAVVLGGMGAFPAMRMAVRTVTEKLSTFGPILGAAMAADFVVPQIFYLVFARSNSLFWQSTVGMLLSLVIMVVTTAFGVVFRVAAFSAYAAEVGMSAQEPAPAAQVPG